MKYMTLETLRLLVNKKREQSTPEEFEQWRSTLWDKLQAMNVVVLSDEPRWP